MNVGVHPNTIMKPCATGEWHAVMDSQTRTTIVIGKKFWPADHWKEFARLWASGTQRQALEALFLGRDYDARDMADMAALLMGNPFVLTPIERALFVLGGLGRRDDRAPGGFRLNGTPAQAANVIHAANRVLMPLGLPEIRYPSRARI